MHENDFTYVVIWVSFTYTSYVATYFELMLKTLTKLINEVAN